MMLQLSSTSRSLVRQHDGSTLVETAISLSVFLTILLGIMGLAQLAYADHFVACVARQATRYASVRGSTYAGTSCATTTTLACQATAANILAYVQAQTPAGLTSTSLNSSTRWPGYAVSGVSCITINGSNSPGCQVAITINYSYNFNLPFMPTNTFTLPATSVAMITQ